MSTVQDAIEAIQAKARALAGMRAAPDYAPDSISAFPFAASYPADGRAETESAGWHIMHYNVVTEIHVSRKDLPRDLAQVMPYVETFINAVASDPTLGGVVTSVEGDILWTFTGFEYAGVQTVGWRFTTKIKQQQTQ